MDLERIHTAIAEGMTAPAVACDLAGHLLYMNPAAERFCGRKLADLQGRSCREFIPDLPPLDRSGVAPTASFESRICIPDHDARPVHITLWPLREQAATRGFIMMLEDLKEVQKLLEALRESEVAYRTLVENMLDGLVQYRVLLDAEGHAIDAVFCEANVAFEKITGIRREAVIGMRVTEVRPDVDREWVELIGQVALTGVPVRFERHSERMGKWFAMLAYSPRENYCAIVSEDITERKAMMQALQESETRYRELVESANSLIIKISAQGQVLFLNDCACQFFNVRAADVVGRDVVGALLSPEDLSAESLRRQMERVRRNPRDYADYEWAVTGADGRKRWISWSLRAICDETEQLQAILAFGNDTTERRRALDSVSESERKFRMLFDNASDGIFIQDLQGNLLEVNSVLCLRLGCDKEAALRRPLPGIYGDDFAGVLETKLAHLGPDQAAVFTATETGATGRSVAVEMSVRRIPYGGGPAVLAVVRDISERRQAEDAQRLAALGQLSAGIAHEFNNLLAAMMMTAEMASFEGTLSHYEEMVEQVLRSCRRGADICQNLISFASPEHLDRQSLHIEEPLETALAIAIREMRNSDIVVQRQYESGPCRVMADPAQLEQVFLNLLINACHAMPHGGTITIATDCDRRAGEPRGVCVRISDTGVGISPENLGRVFEPFFTTKGRLGQSDTPGTGLGLSVSHGIIRAHGGTISVHSEPGQGSSFTIVLPAWQPADDATDGADAGVEAAAAGRPRVLVAEDEADICGLLAQVLRGREYEVVVAADTTQALQALEAAPFNLIVTDWLMPGGGGRQIVARAAQTPANPPVIVITGKLGLGFIEELEPSVVRCLQKPFHLRELLDTIQSAVEG